MIGIPKRIWLFVTLAVLFVLGGLLFWRYKNMETGEPVTINGVTVPPVPALAPDEVARGKSLYDQYCAACHGANLEGVADWKTPLADGTYPPPPHDSSGHTWHHPDALLVQITTDGGLPENGNMPAFKEVLTEDEIGQILSYIKSFWGEEEHRYQWWISYTQNRLYE